MLLQEVDSGVPRSQLMDMAKVLSQATDYPYYDLGLNVNLPKGHYGNATFSKYPINKSQNIDLTIDNKKARGCLYTEISFPNETLKPLYLFNWHLGLSAKERRKQCAILLKHELFKQLALIENCIVAGDFNDWRSLLRIL